jgi:hypothetical protein
MLFIIISIIAAPAAAKTKRYFCSGGQPPVKRDASSDDVIDFRDKRLEPMCFTSRFHCILYTGNASQCEEKTADKGSNPYWDTAGRRKRAASVVDGLADEGWYDVKAVANDVRSLDDDVAVVVGKRASPEERRARIPRERGFSLWQLLSK